MIDNGHGFWMIDGLDEIIAGDDEFLVFLLDRLTNPSSSAPLILIALRDSLLQSREELHELVEMGRDVVHLIELLPWTHEQKRSFVWIRVNGRLPRERERDDFQVKCLLGSLTERGSVQTLSSTPFYADMLADEFQHNPDMSPANEFDLLDLAVTAMCRREYDKGNPIQESVLPLVSFRDWLEEVAGEVVNQSGIPTDELRTLSELVLVLTDSEGSTDSTADTQLVDQMMVMPFLKSSPGSDKFEFTHEILGDFLAGCFCAKRMENRIRDLDWGSRYLGHQALPADSMLLKVIAWKFRGKRRKFVEALRPWPSTKTPGTVHRNVVQLCALMDNARELLDEIGLSLEGADLSGIQFACTDLRGVRLVGSDLSFSDLSKCNLRNTRFESARLRETSLPSKESENLRGATFDGTKSFESIRPKGERRIVAPFEVLPEMG